MLFFSFSLFSLHWNHLLSIQQLEQLITCSIVIDCIRVSLSWKWVVDSWTCNSNSSNYINVLHVQLAWEIKQSLNWPMWLINLYDLFLLEELFLINCSTGNEVNKTWAWLDIAILSWNNHVHRSKPKFQLSCEWFFQIEHTPTPFWRPSDRALQLIYYSSTVCFLNYISNCCSFHNKHIQPHL